MYARKDCIFVKNAFYLIYFRIQGKVNISFKTWQGKWYAQHTRHKGIEDILSVSNSSVTDLINVHKLIDIQVSSTDLY